jgi:sporulation protein YlmC with PRC-barrel domain
MERPFPIHADVYCSDGQCGHSVLVVIDPAARQVTHLVVADKGFLGDEHLVPVDQVGETAAGRIQLNCSTAELRAMHPFLRGEHAPGEIPFIGYDPGEYTLWPTALPDTGMLLADHDHVPTGDVALRRGSSVMATDGRVGSVDEFIVDPANDKITHLVLRQGHLWDQRTISIPVTEIAAISEDAVTLRLTKAEVGALPPIPDQ